MHSSITKPNKSVKLINGNTMKYFYLYRFIHAAGIYWVTVCSTAKGCKENGRSGPCRSGVYNLIRNTRQIYMKPLEKNPQVLYKQEDVEGWGHFSIRGRALYLYDWWESGEEITGQSSKSACMYSGSVEQCGRYLSVTWLKRQPCHLQTV